MTKYSRALTALGAGLLAGVTFGAGAAQAAPPDTIEHCLMTSAADPPGPDCGAEMPLHIMIITLSDDDWPISAVLDHLHLPLMNGPAPGGDVGQPGMPGTPG